MKFRILMKKYVSNFLVKEIFFHELYTNINSKKLDENFISAV